MNIQFKNLLFLLGNSIHPRFLQTFVAEPEWGIIMSMASYHRVLPLVTEAALRHDSFKKYSGKDIITHKSVKLTVEQCEKNEEFCRVYKELTKENIFPLVMKGIICRSLYGKLSEHRTSGDEDILIEEKDFKKTDEILRVSGYLPDAEYYTENTENAVFEIPYTSQNGVSRIEVHFTPLSRHTESEVLMNSYFSSAFTDFREVTINSIVFRTLNHTDHFLFLIFHALKHFTFAGLGIRQITDILLYAEKYSDEIDWGYIKSILKKFNALQFFGDVIALGNEYLGFELDFDCVPEFTELLLNDIAMAGIYGKGTASRRAASQIVGTVVEGGGKSLKYGKVGMLLTTLFPPQKHFIGKNNEMKSKSSFSPAEYASRFDRFLKYADKYKNGAVKEGLEISRERLDLLKKYNLF